MLDATSATIKSPSLGDAYGERAGRISSIGLARDAFPRSVLFFRTPNSIPAS